MSEHAYMSFVSSSIINQIYRHGRITKILRADNNIILEHSNTVQLRGTSLPLISFDIDGTLETGDPKGTVTMDMIQILKNKGNILGSCSDRPVSYQNTCGRSRVFR